MHYIIDRFEGEYALVELEDLSLVEMPKVLLPFGAKEGDIIEITINKNETLARKKRIEKIAKDLWE